MKGDKRDRKRKKLGRPKKILTEVEIEKMKYGNKNP